MTANVLDYFALLGQVPREETDGLGCGLAAESGYADLWNNAITDIAVVCEGLENEVFDSIPSNLKICSGESVEDDWELIDKSVGGLAIDYPLIAIRRRSKSKRLDHICKVPVTLSFRRHEPSVLFPLLRYILLDSRTACQWGLRRSITVVSALILLASVPLVTW